MHQAQVNAWGEPPKYTEVAEPAAPGPDEERVKVLAVGVHRLVQSRAAGKHYTSGKPPHIPGTDGVGVTDAGQHVYFDAMKTGSMVEYINVPKATATPLPAGLDAKQAAILVNPAFSSWMAFKYRTKDLPKNFTVLIMGVTSISGQIAISIARQLGASRVIGVARSKAKLESLGLDDYIVADNEVEKTDFSSLGDVDVILDYFFGPLTTHMFNSLKPGRPIQYVQIGSVSNNLEINLPGAVLRSNDITIRGSGPGAWDPRKLGAELPALLDIITKVPEQSIKEAKLADIEKVWPEVSKEKVVFVL